MKQIFTFSLILFLHMYLFAQNLKKGIPGKLTGRVNKAEKPISFNGQWKGGFTDNSSGFVGFNSEKIDYVLELECNGSYVTGYSYTYFMGGSKRYYTICKLKGSLNRTTKEIVVTEFERTKFNTPPDFRNCFQTHKLKYTKDSGDVETLEGSWMPAPDQTGGCGFGKTTLTRRLMKINPLINSPESYVATAKKITPPVRLNRPFQPPAVSKLKSTVPVQTKKPVTVQRPDIKNNLAQNDKEVKTSIPIITPQIKTENQALAPIKTFEQRSKSLLKTIEIKQDSFYVQLYDNGEIDGDSVSVFYNGSLLVSHKRLSDKPIKLSLSINKSIDINELTMYAENLGTIPPNTALMIVTDGDKRYEVRITSDTEKNGTIAFVHKN